MKYKAWWERVLRNAEGEGGEGGGANPGSGGESGAPSKEAFDALMAEVEALKASNQQLVKDAYTDREAKRKAEKAAQEEAKKLAAEKARQENDYKSLLEQTQEELKLRDQALNHLQSKLASEKVGSVVTKLATKLANTADDAELLAALIAPRLKYNFETEEIKILNAKGEETYNTLDDFEKEVNNTSKFSSLLKSSQRSGGGATGARGGASLKNKTVTRSHFDSMSGQERSAWLKNGGSIVDDN